MGKDTWDAETLALIAKYRAIKHPDQPFEIRSGVAVFDAVKFRQALEQDIDMGPRSPRGRTGAVKSDLLDYLTVMDGRSPEERKLPGEMKS